MNNQLPQRTQIRKRSRKGQFKRKIGKKRRQKITEEEEGDSDEFKIDD